MPYKNPEDHRAYQRRRYAKRLEAESLRKKLYYKKNSYWIDERNKKYREDHREQTRRNASKRYASNLEKSRAYIRLKYSKNKERICELSRQSRLRNLEKAKARSNAWKQNNKDKIRATVSIYQSERRRADPVYKIIGNFRNRVNQIARNKGIEKAGHIIDLIGCTRSQLKTHLESQFKLGMCWDNHGIHGWHIDHILPCASFDMTDPEQRRECFHWTNLQPLWAAENRAKSDKIVA